MAILKSFHLANYRGLNIGHVLPTQNIRSDFVFPKVNPLILKNPAIAEIVVKDSESLKQVGERFIYYRGAHTEREAITISLDLLVADEYDRCDQAVLNTYDSRLQASDFQWRWRFSNPSAVGYGVDRLYQESDQMHWFVKCRRCNHEWFQTWEPDEHDQTQYVDQERSVYACGRCKAPLSDADRQDGRWVPKHPNSPRRGYWVSQLMAPWVPARRVIEQYHESSPDFFHNFVLGLAYTPSDLIVDRDRILKATSPGVLPKVDVCMGVDNGVLKHYVIGTPLGIFAYGKTESWEKIEQLIRQYNCTTVIDANPYPDIPRKLAQKYNGKVFINYYQLDTKQLGVMWLDRQENYGVTKADRTKLLDLVAREIGETQIMFVMRPHELEEFIYHCSNVYRTTEVNNQGIEKGVWITQENKPDHYFHAMAYYRMALEMSGKKYSGPVQAARPIETAGVTVNPDNTIPGIDTRDVLRRQGRG